ERRLNQTRISPEAVEGLWLVGQGDESATSSNAGDLPPGLGVDDLIDAVAPAVELPQGSGLALTAVAPRKELARSGSAHLRKQRFGPVKGGRREPARQERSQRWIGEPGVFGKEFRHRGRWTHLLIAAFVDLSSCGSRGIWRFDSTPRRSSPDPRRRALCRRRAAGWLSPRRLPSQPPGACNHSAAEPGCSPSSARRRSRVVSR